MPPRPRQPVKARRDSALDQGDLPRLTHGKATRDIRCIAERGELTTTVIVPSRACGRWCRGSLGELQNRDGAAPGSLTCWACAYSTRYVRLLYAPRRPAARISDGCLRPWHFPRRASDLLSSHFAPITASVEETRPMLRCGCQSSCLRTSSRS